MSDYNQETAFLRRMLLYDESRESRNVEERIARVQRDHTSVCRAAWTMGLLGLLSLVLSQSEFFQSEPPIRLRVLCVAGLAATICLAAFVGVLILYRTKLNTLRNECRDLITKLMETQGSPRPNFLVVAESRESVAVADNHPVLPLDFLAKAKF